MLAQSQDAQAQPTVQDSPVAEAARRSREKKKNPPNTSKSPKVITDDDLDRRSFQPGQDGLNVGSSPKLETEEPSNEAVRRAEASDKASEQQTSKGAASEDAEIARVKLQVAEGEKDLDLASRQAALDQDTYLANPDYAHDRTGKAKLDVEKNAINDKKEQVDRLKARLASLEELKKQRNGGSTPEAQTPQIQNPPRS
jgi:hypothetical protein